MIWWTWSSLKPAWARCVIGNRRSGIASSSFQATIRPADSQPWYGTPRALDSPSTTMSTVRSPGGSGNEVRSQGIGTRVQDSRTASARLGEGQPDRQGDAEGQAACRPSASPTAG